MQPKVTILVPNYKTLELTKLCLRLLRKHTDQNLAKVVVIDNDSQDSSVEYLRTLPWITLIERKSVPGQQATLAHSQALDMALASVNTPYVLSIHTDTLVKHPKWLEFLLAQIENDPSVAGVGSWKLEMKPWWRRALKSIEHYCQKAYFKLLGRTDHGLEGVGKNYYYLRSHCAMYRTDLVQKLQLSFSDGDMVAGKSMHQKLLQAGYRMLFLPSETLGNYVEHINHATTVLNPELSSREKSVQRGRQRIEKSLARMNAEQVLQDASLDV
jgi:GT2 family glycosyltransferase